jgi:hypothetical protein
MYLAKEYSSGYTIYSLERDSYSPERLALMAELHRPSRSANCSWPTNRKST